jgi:hypothetical protein
MESNKKPYILDLYLPLSIENVIFPVPVYALGSSGKNKERERISSNRDDG